MKKGDLYQHYKDVEYCFEGIALPLTGKGLLTGLINVKRARYHEDTHDVDIFVIDGVMFIDSHVPHVIYQSEKDYNKDLFYAREVDDFFGCKEENGTHVKRFTLKSNKPELGCETC